VLRNNVEGSVADFNIKVLSRIYKKKKFTNNKGDLLKTETDRIDPVSLKYNETYSVTNREGVFDPGLGTDKVRDTDITISLVRVTTVEKDLTGNVVKDPVTGLPKTVTTDAAGGTGVTDIPTENLKEYLMYAGVVVVIAAVGYGAYWYISRQPVKGAK
jgi:hypothetical protein